MLLFGAIQILFSQIPNFHDMEWLSVIAAIMSFAYTFIGMALSFANVIGIFTCLYRFCDIICSCKTVLDCIENSEEYIGLA